MSDSEQSQEQYASLEDFFIDSCRYGYLKYYIWSDFQDVLDCLEDKVNIAYLDDNLNNCIRIQMKYLKDMASANGHLNILEAIIEFGMANKINIQALVNQQNQDGCTPLHWAVVNDQLKVIEVLIQYGAEIRLKNNNKMTALDEAINLNKNQDLISKFISLDSQQQDDFQQEVNEEPDEDN